MIRKHQYLKDCRTGDLIFFDSADFVSGVIKSFSEGIGKFGDWAHVGMIINETDWPDFPSRPFIFESTATLQKMFDVWGEKGFKGVVCMDLEKRLKKHKGKVGIKRLSKELSDFRKARLYDLVNELKGTPYDFLQLPGSVLDGALGIDNEESVKRLFCSELVVFTLRNDGLIFPTEASSEYTPQDVSKFNKLAGDYEYSEVIGLVK